MTNKNYFPISDSVKWQYSSGFGSRNIGGGASTNHKGIDIAAPKGSAVLAYSDGKVIFSGEQKGYGNVVYIRHDDGSTTRYAHLSKIDIQNGIRINGNQKLGEVGNSGISIGRDGGYHLHFEYRNKSGEAINPKNLLNESLDQANQSPQTLTNLNSENDQPLSPKNIDPSPNQNPTTQSENNPQEEVSVDAVKDMLATEDMKQTANFMSEVKLQLPSMMGVMVARLALGEDIELVSADMASRLIATSAINAYAENNWSSSFAS